MENIKKDAWKIFNSRHHAIQNEGRERAFKTATTNLVEMCKMLIMSGFSFVITNDLHSITVVNAMVIKCLKARLDIPHKKNRANTSNAGHSGIILFLNLLTTFGKNFTRSWS